MMYTPKDAINHLSEQMGWLNQLLGEDFWTQIQAAGEAGLPPGRRQRPPGELPVFPPVDIYTMGVEVVLSAALPGLAGPGQVSLSQVGPAELILEAFVPPPPTLDLALQRERFAGYCVRSLPLPTPIALEGARGFYRDGILEIRLPRVQPGQGDGSVAVLQIPGGPKHGA